MDGTIPRFDQRAIAIVEAAIQQAGASVPELEGGLFIPLYRLPDQGSIPSILVVGAGRALSTPDQLGRLARLLAEAQVVLAQKYADSLMALRAIEAELARLIEADNHELRSRSGAGAEAQGQGP